MTIVGNPNILTSIAMKRDSTLFGSHRERPVGERPYGRNVEPVLELYTEYLGARLYWERPLQRKGIDCRSVLVEAHAARCE